MILSSHIILTSNQARNSESNLTIITNRISQLNISAIDCNSNLTGSIGYIDSYNNCLIIKINDISRNNSHVGIRHISLINMEHCACIAAVVIRIITIFNGYIIFAYCKVWNFYSNCWAVFSCKCSSIHFCTIDFNNNSTASICNRNSYSNCFIIKISDIDCFNTYIGI